MKCTVQPLTAWGLHGKLGDKYKVPVYELGKYLEHGTRFTAQVEGGGSSSISVYFTFYKYQFFRYHPAALWMYLGKQFEGDKENIVRAGYIAETRVRENRIELDCFGTYIYIDIDDTTELEARFPYP